LSIVPSRSFHSAATAKQLIEARLRLDRCVQRGHKGVVVLRRNSEPSPIDERFLGGADAAIEDEGAYALAANGRRAL
jgi:hypothetical protein